MTDSCEVEKFVKNLKKQFLMLCMAYLHTPLEFFTWQKVLPNAI